MDNRMDLSRRAFLELASVGMVGAPLVLAADKTVAAPAAAIPDRLPPSKWPEGVCRRFSVDIHVPDWDPALLSKFDAKAYVECMVRAGNQSLLQYTNSHVGLCLWNTKVGKKHHNTGDRDFFGEVVAECRKRGVHPLAYYSLIHDNWMFETHEDWRVIFPDGSVPKGRYGLVCPNSPYRDYVMACIKEIAGGYDIDGMFFDMTFWPGICYCPHCAARFRKEQNAELPRTVDWDEPVWRAFQKAREQWLLEFALDCTNTAKAARPGITVNHQFSTIFHPWGNGVPLELTQACDYVGGDFYSGPAQHSLACKVYNSLTRSHPFEFHTSRTRIYTDHVTVKPMEEIGTEAYVATLHSAALMLVDYINVDGTVNADAYEFLGKLSAQRAVYEPFLGGEMLADAAIYFDKESLYNPAEKGVEITKSNSDSLPHREAVTGWARLLQAAHIPFGVVTNVTLDQLSRYRAVCLPSVLEMTAEQAQVFRRFVEDGGLLFASGPSSLDRSHEGGPAYLLEDVLGVKWTGTTGSTMTYLTPEDGELKKAVWPQDHVSFAGAMVQATAASGTEVLARVTLPFVDPALGKNIGSHFAAIHSNPPALQTGDAPALVVNRFGKGRAVWFAAPMESRDEAVNRNLLLALLRRYLAAPLKFQLDTHPAVEATLFHQPDQHRLRLSLLNLQRDLPQTPVGAKASVLLPEGTRLRSVTRLPDGNHVATEEKDRCAHFEIEPFAPFAMFAVEYEGGTK